ncbi:MAG: DUF1326 domain-containing protein [Acidobacteria bacterium]|nr:DUF1326 domain-containing protein [Acidobacteriota bacterium]MBI3281202.1 DUF1326 domain-containing protein [Acidobacteriota bacterium]
MAYQVEGKLLEVCTCKILCPCWVGEDPDNGTCDGLLVWQVEKGTVDGVDVGGRILAILCHIPGNILKGNWNVRIYVDDKASSKQKDAILNVWSGKLGGPIADLAKLIGKIDSVEDVPITFNVKGVDGNLRIGSAVEASLEAYRGATGEPTAMHDTIFTTIPGSPAFVGKANSYKAHAPGFNIDLKGHNAVSGAFRFTG